MSTPNIKIMKEGPLGKPNAKEVFPITYIEAVRGLREKLQELDQTDTSLSELLDVLEENLSQFAQGQNEKIVNIKQDLKDINERIDVLIGEGDTSTAIDTFNEIKAFLAGISDTTLEELLNNLKTYTDGKFVTSQEDYLYQAGAPVARIKGIGTLRVEGGIGNTSGILITDTVPASGSLLVNTCALYNDAGTLKLFSQKGKFSIGQVCFDRVQSGERITGLNHINGLTSLSIENTGTLYMGEGIISLGSGPNYSGYIQRSGAEAPLVIHSDYGVNVENSLNVDGTLSIASGLSMQLKDIRNVSGIGMTSGIISGVSQIQFTNGNIFTGKVTYTGDIDLENVGDVISSGGRLAGFAVANADVINAGKLSDQKDVVTLDSDGVLVRAASGNPVTTIKSNEIVLGSSGTLNLNGGKIINAGVLHMEESGLINANLGTIRDLNKVHFNDLPYDPQQLPHLNPEIGVDVDDSESLVIKTNILTIGEGKSVSIDHNKIYFNGDLASGTGTIQGAYLNSGVLMESLKFTTGFISALQDALNGGTGHIVNI